MAIESMVALALAVALLAGIAWYASKHREEDKDRHDHLPKATS